MDVKRNRDRNKKPGCQQELERERELKQGCQEEKGKEQERRPQYYTWYDLAFHFLLVVLVENYSVLVGLVGMTPCWMF